MIGIDFGTTSSCVAVMEGGLPQVIPNQEGERTTPSVVAFQPEGTALVGSIARRQALVDQAGTVFGVKRLIGRKFDSREREAMQRFVPNDLVPLRNGDVGVRAHGRVYSLPEICAVILQKLKAAAEDYLGESVEKAIITVPAYWNDPQRQATKDAGLIAGLKVSRIINAPTAAALAYGLRNTDKSEQMVAVFDLGGGTFDITILEMADGLFQVRATGGDTFLGGDDFDERIMEWVLSELKREAGSAFRQTPELLLRVRAAAEKAKRDLSVALATEIALPFIENSGVRHLQRTLTRRQYGALTQDLLDHTISPCLRCLADAQMKPEQIDEVLLVGGQSRAPGVVSLVRQIFGREPSLAVHPEESVAMGAAIQAAITYGDVKDLVLLDVAPFTLGIETKNGTFTPLIDRNSTIPTRKSRVFTTVADNQRRIEIHVLQGESDMAAYNTSLATFELTSITPAPQGEPQIEVGFDIDVNGIVSVEATDQATGRRQAITIHPSGGLSQADVNRLVDETRRRESEDKSTKEQEAVVRQLDGLVANTMRSVQVLEAKLTADEQKRILDSIERAKKAHGDRNLEELMGLLAEMEMAAGIIGQAMLRPGSAFTPPSE
jgi:molecular chaperone DnaK